MEGIADNDAKVEIARRYLNGYMNRHQLSVLDDILAKDVMYVSPLGAYGGYDAVRTFLALALERFRGLSVDLHTVLAGDHHVMVRATVHGTQVGAVGGIRPSHRKFCMPVVYVFEFTGEKISKLEVFYDSQTLISEIASGSPMPLR